MRAVRRVDQLRGNAHAPACLAHRAFEDVADTQFAPDLLHIDRLALVRKTGVAGDDKEPADTRQRSDDFLDHAVREILLLGVAAHVLECHDRQRRLIRQRRRCAWQKGRGIGVRLCRDPCNLRSEAIAPPSDCLDATALQLPVIKEPAERRDLQVKIVVLDHYRRPDESDDLVPRQEFPCSPDQHAENVERARADRDRHEDTALVAPGQAAPIETKPFELENIVHGERVPPCALHARPRLRRF